MRGRSTAGWAGGVAAAALVLAACGGGSDPAPAAGGDAGAAGGAVSVGNCKPENPLIPSDTNEVCGGNVMDALFTGLYTYNPDTAAPELAVAASVESTDNTTWTVKLNEGWTFHDGSPVDAKSFVDAWNDAAFGPNARQNSYFMAYIDGFEEVNAEKSTVKEMSGLTVVDPTSFEVKLSTPQSSFPIQLGYTAFSPLPPAFFTDPDAFGTKPIGNGPFKFDEGNGDVGYKLSAFAEYKGADKPKIANVDFRTYQTDQAEYNDLLADNLDFVDQVPASALNGDKWQTDLPDRNISKEVGVIQTGTFPLYVPEYANADFHKAFSMAIDRQLIVDRVYAGGRTPATGWVSPVVNGYEAGACGEWCTYDPAKAKELLTQSGFNGDLTYSYNADGPGNKEGAEAICNSVKGALGIECAPKPYVDFSTLRTDVNARKMTGPFRTGWQMDYPAIENFLAPLYATGASSNDNDYSNPEFDALLKKAAAEKGDAANATYNEAEKLLANDMATVPLWYSAQQSGWSTKVSNVKVTPFGTLDLSSITVNAG